MDIESYCVKITSNFPFRSRVIQSIQPSPYFWGFKDIPIQSLSQSFGHIDTKTAFYETVFLLC
jgi:hypothetical protein